MNTVFTVGDFPVAVWMIGLVCAVLFPLVPGLILRAKGICGFAGALGIALLPAVAIMCLFGAGTPADEGVPMHLAFLKGTWFASNRETWAVLHLESVILLLLFAALMLWIVLRKTDIAPDRDILFVALTLLGAEQVALGRLHAGEFMTVGAFGILQPAGAFLMLLCMLLWSLRVLRRGGHGGLTLVCWLVFLIGLTPQALRMLTGLTAGHLLYDELILWGCLLLSLKAVLCMGRVSRCAERSVRHGA